MSRLQKLKTLLFEELGRRLASYGFRGRFSVQTFYAPTDFGWAAFNLGFILHRQTDFDVTADVALRVNAVEDLISRDKRFSTARPQGNKIAVRQGGIGLIACPSQLTDSGLRGSGSLQPRVGQRHVEMVLPSSFRRRHRNKSMTRTGSPVTPTVKFPINANCDFLPPSMHTSKMFVSRSCNCRGKGTPAETTRHHGFCGAHSVH